jgi:hypothetical protein
LPWLAGAVALVVNSGAAVYYHQLGLTLSHYDARGHLVVARRVFDSITPGWQQIGAVWLPLPHLLNLLPVQIDAMYRSGASGVAISIVAGAAAAAAIAWIVLRLTDSALAAALAAGTFALNPNMLYLQATPMTEPLLLGLSVSAVALLMAWSATAFDRKPHDGHPSAATGIGDEWRPRPVSTTLLGTVMALACLTRYEAWPVVAAALPAAVFVRIRNGDSALTAVRRVATVALYPSAAILAFVVLSRVVVGEWFTASGFFVPENKALGRPLEALLEIIWGSHALTGTWLMVLAAIGWCWLIAAGTARRRRAEAVIALALIAAAALPWAAFVRGHPFRIRYMVPLIAAQAVGLGVTIAIVRRAVPITAIVVMLLLASETRPFSPMAPMVLEAQWDRPNVSARRHVTDCLRSHDDGETIMASMGSLGHYMQEMSAAGVTLRRFLHEGNGDIWLTALNGPRRFAGWLLIEEKAEGGDVLAHLARARPAFLSGYERVCEGAGVALYRRTGAAN